ncbi:50S ribosomal protein L9 [Anaplasma platys]|uniref:Large ribosomal subunit protein bL9 n=1 Tax=Anaplasma platys TaxID=949 RepID=A0A858PXG1_9RICK|nr:50S ribosomal protein L9 [Anaplasma platys]
MLSVILRSSVRGLGKAGEVARVKPGYARYLLSDGKAVRATKRNMELLEEKLSVIAEQSEKKLREADKAAASLAEECLIIIRQASDDGKLFGSVTVRDVAKLLDAIGYAVQPKEVFFSETIKRTGEYDVSVELHADLVAVVKLHVVRNDAEAERVKLAVAREKKSRSEVVAAEAAEAASSGASAVAESEGVSAPAMGESVSSGDVEGSI